ncbi:MAG: nascent polypeptide-associated complex protein [Nitrososphaerales archaeon]
MGINVRQARRMLERLGVNFEEVKGVEEVIIRTQEKDIVIKGAQVAQLKTKELTVFQVSGENIEEVKREKPKFTEEDVLLVAQQAGVSEAVAREALIGSNGDLAKAIMSLKTS